MTTPASHILLGNGWELKENQSGEVSLVGDLQNVVRNMSIDQDNKLGRGVRFHFVYF